MGATDRRSFLTRRGAVRVVIALALFAGVVFAVDEFVPGAGDRLGQASPDWLAASVGLELVALASYAVLFHAVFARAPHPIGRRRSAKIAVGELGAFAIVPTGVGGPLLRFWALRTSGMQLRTIVVRSVSHAGIFNAPYVLAALFVGLGVSLRLLPGHAPLVTALAPAGLVLATCLVVAAAAALSRAEFMRRGGKWRSRILLALGTVPDGVRDMISLLRRPTALLGALGWWIADCAALWAAFNACGSPPALSVLLLAYMLGQLGSALVPLPGGIGGVESLMLGIFVASGVGIGLAAAAIVCYRAIALGLQGAIGAVAVISLASELRPGYSSSSVSSSASVGQASTALRANPSSSGGTVASSTIG
jgi:uncharacterized membrane protein YbhN (UPF0104 family)